MNDDDYRDPPESPLGRYYRSIRMDGLADAADREHARLQAHAKKSGRIHESRMIRSVNQVHGRPETFEYSFRRPDPSHRPVEPRADDSASAANAPPTESELMLARASALRDLGRHDEAQATAREAQVVELAAKKLAESRRRGDDMELREKYERDIAGRRREQYGAPAKERLAPAHNALRAKGYDVRADDDRGIAGQRAMLDEQRAAKKPKGKP